jgi:hypothetical protein
MALERTVIRDTTIDRTSDPILRQRDLITEVAAHQKLDVGDRIGRRYLVLEMAGGNPPLGTLAP